MSRDGKEGGGGRGGAGAAEGEKSGRGGFMMGRGEGKGAPFALVAPSALQGGLHAHSLPSFAPPHHQLLTVVKRGALCALVTPYESKERPTHPLPPYPP